MIELYSKEDFVKTKSARDKILKVFYITFGILFLINVAVFVFFVRQEFETKYKLPLLLFNIITDSVYAIIYFIIFAIKYKRVNSYYKMLKDFNVGLRQEGVNTFVRVDSSLTAKDGVDFISLVFLQWSDKKQEFFERNILLDVEKPIPALKRGDVVKHSTHANILIAYELANAQVFD